MLRILKWLSVPAMAVALLAVACGGDEEASDDTVEEATTAATTTESGESSSSTDGSSDDAGEEEFAALVGAFGSAVFSTTYEIEGLSAEGEQIAGEWNWVQDSPGGRSRFEATMDGQTVIMISTMEQSVMCAEGACFSLSGAAGAMMPNLSELLTGQIDEIEAEAVESSVTFVGTRDFDGVEGRCWDFEDPAGDGTGTACYTSDGVPLLIESHSSDGDFSMRAVSYSDEVSDGDFEPPFPVTSLEGMGTP